MKLFFVFLATVMNAQAQLSPLAGNSWRVADLAGKAPLRDHPISMIFDAKGRLTGEASCNRFSGTFTVEEDRITVSRVRVTRRACEEPVMAQERQFLNLFEALTTWTITDENVLVLHGATGEIKATRREKSEDR